MTGSDWTYILQQPAKFDIGAGLTITKPAAPVQANSATLSWNGALTVPNLAHFPPTHSTFLGATDALSLLTFLEQHKEELERLSKDEQERKRSLVKEAVAELEGLTQ